MNPLTEALLTFVGQAAVDLLMWSWQAFVLLACVWAGLKLFRVRTPELRQHLWFISLLAVLTLPLWPKSTLPQRQLRNGAALNYVAELPRLVFVPAAEAGLPAPPSKAVIAPKKLRLSQILPAIFGLWLAGVFLILFSNARGYIRLRRDCRQARPVTLEELGSGLGLPSSISLSLSPDIHSPVLFGIWNPVILLPHDLAEWTTAEERDAMIAHELAHLARRDHLTNLLPLVLNVIFFFHPLVRYACRQFCLEREMACDDRVINQGFDAATYAESLVKAAERNIKGKLNDLASNRLHQPAFLTSKQALERRIEMVLKTDRVRVLARRWWYLILPGALIVAMAWLLVPDRHTTAQQLQKQLDDAAGSVKDGSLKGVLDRYLTDTTDYDNLVKTVLSTNGQLREQALRRLMESEREWATAALGEIYDKTRELALRSSLIDYLGQRRASSKLLKLATSEPNTQLRQQATQRLLEMESEDRSGALIELYASVRESAVRESIIRSLGRRGDIRGLALVGDLEDNPTLDQLNRQQLEWMATSHENANTRRKAQEWLAMLQRQALSNDRKGQDLPPPPPPPPPQRAAYSPPSLNDSAAVAKLLQEDPNDANIVRAMLRESGDAVIRRDTTFFEKALADDYQEIGINGEIKSKGQVIAEIKHPQIKFTRIEIDDLRLKGDVNSMVAIYLGTAYYEEDGKEQMVRVRVTDNLIKRRGGWQWVGSHVSLTH